MATEKKPAEAAPPKGAKGKKGGGKLRLITIMILLGLAAPFLFPTILLMMIGLLPTIVALFADTDRERSSTIAVGSMNCAGVTPFVIDLWLKGQTMANVFVILREPSNWVIMLGAAAIGQLIVFAIPHAMASLMLARAEVRLKTLKGNLEQLKNVWGQDVGTTKPLDKIVRPD